MGQFFSLADLGLATSQGALLQNWLQTMQAQFGNDYNPSAANPEYVQAQIFASWAADVAQLAAAGSSELFRQFGVQELNLAFQQGTPASATLSVLSVDTLGHTLPVGTQLTLTLNGVQLAFQTASTLTIAPGNSQGTVTVIAIQSGTAFNGANNPAALVSQITWVSSISVASATSGGVDQESDDLYLTRLANTLQLLAPRPITASDFSTIAENFIPASGTDQEEVGRATTIDGYEPAAGVGVVLGSGAGSNPNTYNNAREVTVCISDVFGNALNSDTLAAVQAYLTNLREVNFIVNVMAPNYTTIYVAATVAGATGYTASTVQTNVQTSLLAYLSPQNFGLPQGSLTGWTNSTTLYRSKVIAAIQNTAGVDHVISLAVDTNPTPSNTTNDVVLPGPFPLPISSVSSIPTNAITVM